MTSQTAGFWFWLVRTMVKSTSRLYGWYCAGYQRGVHPSRDLTGDHALALSRGGQSTRTNVSIHCRACNSAKGGRGVVDRGRGVVRCADGVQDHISQADLHQEFALRNALRSRE
jgi:5-methylcytosine-specific restriction endonuclease McrA